MHDDPLGLIDCSADHNDMVDVLLGTRQLMQRFAELALEPEANTQGAEPDARLLSLCLGVCAVRARLLRWLALIETPQSRDPAPPGDDRRDEGTLLR